MKPTPHQNPTLYTSRFSEHGISKSRGVVYTPTILADFVAREMVKAAGDVSSHQQKALRILDPSLGGGELVMSLLRELPKNLTYEVHGFDTDLKALKESQTRLQQTHSHCSICVYGENFLDDGDGVELGSTEVPQQYDMIIANPPYVRTQIMGAKRSRRLAQKFGLSGRIDLYYAFVLAMAQKLAPRGIAGIILSNGFMTTKAGASLRKAVGENFEIIKLWDLGDTKLFDAAVLPAVLILQGRHHSSPSPSPIFTSIYRTTKPALHRASTPLKALSYSGVVKVDTGECFEVCQGYLDTSTPEKVWTVSTSQGEQWLKTVEAHSWGTFQDVGPVRVGVKTCADKIYIRRDWHQMTDFSPPELLKPLTTHHIARRFKPLSDTKPRYILYPHEIKNDKRSATDLKDYPHSYHYLSFYRKALESRKYVLEAGRQWYELWVPQDPGAWKYPKLVFRDIAPKPIFWMDLSGSVVNGDSYWISTQNPNHQDLLWLIVAVANSEFMERFYDQRFHNKLYGDRRRFLSQYVKHFPLPDPNRPLSKALVKKAKDIYRLIPSPRAQHLEKELSDLVWEAFGGLPKKIRRQ